MHTTHCEGWWEQRRFGRQSMENLRLTFADGRITGQGADIIGPFQFSGQMQQDQVQLQKRYLGRHSVLYLGSYDGEGVLHGRWQLPGDSGPWMIKIVSVVETEPNP